MAVFKRTSRITALWNYETVKYVLESIALRDFLFSMDVTAVECMILKCNACSMQYLNLECFGKKRHIADYESCLIRMSNYMDGVFESNRDAQLDENPDVYLARLIKTCGSIVDNDNFNLCKDLCESFCLYKMALESKNAIKIPRFKYIQ